MKYKITVDIESTEKLNPYNLQQVKSMVEEIVIENLNMPVCGGVYINTRVTKESD